MQSEKDRLTQEQIDELKIKQDILAELDNFLLENNNETQNVSPDLNLARTRALRELDRLIKQDLSASEILTRLKSRTDNKPLGQPEQKISDFYSSIHVVDLRHNYSGSAEKKSSFFSKFSRKKKEPTIHSEQDIQDLELEDDLSPELSIVAEPAVQAEQVIAPVDQPISDRVIEEKQIIHNYRLVFKKTALTAIITLVILLPVQGFVFVGRMQEDKDKLLNYGQSGFLAFKSGILKASSNSYHEADIDFEAALADFDKAKNILNKYNDKLPIVGDTLKSGENVLSITTSLSQAAKIINNKRDQSMNVTDYIEILNKNLDELLPLLEDTNKRLDKLVGLPENVKTELVYIKSELEPLLVNLKKLKTITLTLGNLLGSDKEQRYLLLFQNNNEIRAGGGFIGSYALLDVNKGKIVQMEIPKGGTYDLTAGQKKQWRSPQALAIVNTTFNIWDANWWPDFPTSARKISKLFSENSGSSVDGVVAINATVLQKLLAITGPVDFPEYNVQINSENVINVLQAEIEGKRNEKSPKTIISDLAPKILEKVFTANDQVEDIFGLLATILENKDLQIYSTDQNIDKQISNLGWRGEMMQTDRDYLWVVSTNIAGGKTDLMINQMIEHEAVISEDGDIINTVKLTRSNDGSADNIFLGLDGANVSYLRFFVPLGSQLISATGFDDIPEYYFANNKQYELDPDLIEEESKLIDNESKTEIFSSLDRTVFANWQTLKAGETKTVTLTYKLPFSLDLGNQLTNDWKKIFLASSRHFDHYSLLVQSQSGQVQSIINSRVILPQTSKIIWQVASDENSFQVQNNETMYNQNLNSDKYFGVVVTTE